MVKHRVREMLLAGISMDDPYIKAATLERRTKLTEKLQVWFMKEIKTNTEMERNGKEMGKEMWWCWYNYAQSKFHIPVKESRNLYGVCDPKGEKREGELPRGVIPANSVFVQISSPSGNFLIILLLFTVFIINIAF